MPTSILTILKQHAISLARLAQATGLNRDELLTQLNQPVATWSIQFLNSLAESLNQRPGQLLDQLQGATFHLAFDDERWTIETVQFSSLAAYQQARFAVETNVLEGWQPTNTEIQHLKIVTEETNYRLLNEINQLFGGDSRD